MNQTDKIVALGLEQLSEGFGIFDDDLNLVSCNTMFRKLRNYSEDLCRPGTSLESMIRYNAERGDFGPGFIDEQVARRMSEIRKSAEREIIREMHDGRILKIRYQRIEGGGLTITFEDKTDEQKAKRALEESEERHSLVARATSDGLYDWNVTTNKLYVSERLNELFAFDDSNITSQQWADRVHKEDLPIYIAAIRNHFKGATDHLECQYRIAGKAGDYRWVRDYAVGVQGKDGRVQRLVGAVRDVTDIETAENKRDQAEKRLLDSLETIEDGFLLVDAADRVQLWNRRYMEIFSDAAGMDISDIVRKDRPFLDMIEDGYKRNMFKPHPKGAAGWIAERRQARENPVSQLELELNSGRWLLINERTMSDGGRVSVYTDITDFKTREGELEAEKIRFEDAIESLSTGFALFDANDRLVVCNTKYREYFIKLEDLVTPGTTFTEIIRSAVDRGLFPTAVDNPDAWIAALIEERAATSEVREQHLENGLWLQISDHRTKDGGIVSIYADITLLKQREADITAAKNEAEQALDSLQKTQVQLIHAEKMASLGQLTAGIAHEIKNPLNFVNNFSKLSAEMLEELTDVLEEPLAALDEIDREDAEDLLATVRGNLLKIDEHGKRADSIVKNMLLHSREGPGEKQLVDLGALAVEALNLAYHGARATDSSFNVEMITEISPDLAPAECHPQDLQRVFLNLCSNGMYEAVKRFKAGGAPPVLTVAGKMEGDFIIVEVSDNGGGVPAEIRDKIFQPFFTTKPTGEGTGLGLSMSYDIVKQHGGILSLNSKTGRGTTFRVSIPANAKAEAS
jgi:PAS domain S-box-containing protein